MILALAQGAVVGLLASDFVMRKRDREEREALKAELVATQKGLAELHNKNADAMRGLQDKVNAHAMALAAGVKLK